MSISFAAAAAPKAVVKVQESGFGVAQFDQCGYAVPPTGQQSRRPPRATIFDIECSPGGAFGAYVYVAAGTINSDFDPVGFLERVTFTGSSSLFPGGELGNYNPTRLSFTPSGWRGGDLINVTLNAGGFCCGDGFVAQIDAADVGQASHGFRFGTVGESAVDPSGGFGSDMFIQTADGYAGDATTFIPAGIYRVDSSGAESAFAPVRFGEMRFGRGGAWGTDLYVDGDIISPNGTSRPLGTVFGEFDWADGSGLNGDMFAHVAGQDPGTVFRITPGGTATVFATGAPGHIAGCNGSLWIANQSGCFVVTKKGH